MRNPPGEPAIRKAYNRAQFAGIHFGEVSRNNSVRLFSRRKNKARGAFATAFPLSKHTPCRKAPIYL